MNRREAINRVALIFGGTIIGGQLFLEGCTRPATKEVASLFEKTQTDFLGDIADTILPATKTPGAKEAGVGEFMPIMVRDCYTEQDQKTFMEGLTKLEETSNTKYSKNFQQLSAEERTALLIDLDKEQQEYHRNKKEDEPNHYFRMIKELTMLGYFTSELGTTKALRYNPIPGRYDGNIPYTKGDKAWA